MSTGRMNSSDDFRGEKKSVDDLELMEILKLCTIMGIEYDKNRPVTSELKGKLQKKFDDQDSGSGLYSDGISGVSVISKAKKNDIRNKKKLLEFYQQVENCLNKLRLNDLSIINDYLGLNTDVFHEMHRTKESLGSEEYYLLIAGESSSGKSTIFNLILGGNVLPSHTLHTTSTICEVKYGAQKQLRLHYKLLDPRQPSLPPRTINLKDESICKKSHVEQIAEYVGLKDEERKTIKYERVEIFWPHELLQKGVVFVDSPGLGESDVMDSILMNYLPKAFAYIYIIDVSRAGGLQQALKEKMKAMAAKMEMFNGGRDVNCLYECALFIGNKWDLVKKDERNSVQEFVIEELGKCWSGSNIKKQTIFLSALDAFTVQQYGGIAPDFKKLLESLAQMIKRAIDVRNYQHWQFLDTILSYIRQVATVIRDRAYQTQVEVDERLKWVESRNHNIEENEKSATSELAESFPVHTRNLSEKMKEFLNSWKFSELFFWWSDADLQIIKKGQDWEEKKRKIDGIITRRYSALLYEWEKTEKVHEKIHSEIVGKFLKRLKILKEELQVFWNNGSGVIRQAENLRNRGQLLPTKVLIGATLPIWLPVATAGFVIVAPLYGIIRALSLQSERRRLEEFENSPIEYLEHRTQKFLEAVLSEDILPVANELMHQTEKFVLTYSSFIPKLLEADRKTVEVLRNETFTKETLIQFYTPIIEKSEELRKSLLPLGLELFPPTLDCRDLTYFPQTIYHIGEGQFSQVYRGKLDISTPFRTDEVNELLNVSVKVFKRPFDFLNGRFYMNEEMSIRHLEHDNVLDFLGSFKRESLLGTGTYVYVFVTPFCRVNLRQRMSENDHVVPATSMLARDAMIAINMFFKWAKEIAAGLDHIHENGLVHRHLKLENILVKDDDSVAISDVGIIGQFKESEKSIIYQAPEVMENSENMTKASDIYSYGIMLWEMWHGVTAFQEIRPLEIEFFKEIILDGYRPELEVEHTIIHTTAHNVMKACWPTAHSERMEAKKCLETLQKATDYRNSPKQSYQ